MTYSPPVRKKLAVYTGLLIIAASLAAFITWQRRLKTIPAVRFPSVKLPSANAFDTFVRAGNAWVSPEVAVDEATDSRPPLIGSNGIDYRRDYPPEARKAWLRRNDTALTLFREGLQQTYLHPLYLSPRSSFSHLPAFRNLAKLMAAHCHDRAHSGDWPGAAAGALDIIRFGATVPRGAPLLAALCGYSIQAEGRRELWQALPHLNEEDLRFVLSRLDEIESARVDYRETLEAERWLSQATLLDMMKKGGWNRSFFQGEPALAVRWKLLRMDYPYIMENNRRIFDDQVEAAAKPWAGRSIKMPPLEAADPVSVRVAAFYDVGAESARGCDAGNRLLRTAVALRYFRLRNGRYPRSLQQLTPGYLAALPADPFGAGPLRYTPRKTRYTTWLYRRVRDTPSGSTAKNERWLWQGRPQDAYTDFTLYSLGPNAQDDGGSPSQDQQTTGAARYDLTRPQLSQLDIVAGVNW